MGGGGEREGGGRGREEVITDMFLEFFYRLVKNLLTSSCYLLQICYHNKYGIMPHGPHGGSYPYASLNTAGNTATNDYCMAVGVLAKGSNAHGWSQASSGYDSPSSDSDWPNRSYIHQSPHLTVWLK